MSTTVLVNLQVAFFALVTMLGGEAMLRGIGGLAVPAASGGQGSGGVAAVSVGNLKQVTAVRSRGDRSRSWRWPGTRRIDSAMRALPVKLAPFSPLLARIAVDGASVRAILGAGGMLLPAAGVMLGAAVLHDTGGMSTPPAVGLLAAVAVLGVWDALAGFLAVTVFVAGVAIAGHLGTATEIRTMLGMSVIWFAVPLIAGAARPLRRSAAQSLADWRAWGW